MYTCVEMGVEVGKVLELICKHGVCLLGCSPARYIDEVVRVRYGNRPHPAHLDVCKVRQLVPVSQELAQQACRRLLEDGIAQSMTIAAILCWWGT